MTNPSDSDPAVEQELGSGTYDHLQVGGTWTGPALESEGSATTIRDSRLTTTGAEPAVASVESGEGPGLLFQRSIASVPPAASYAVYVVNGNATLDSSEVLGGQDALVLVQSASKQRTLTIAGSTVDAGVLGERDASSAHGVAVEAAGTASVANVNIEGSIVLEPQTANTGPGDSANISCTYSDVPNQTQAAAGTEGTINCANGTSGDATEPLTSLFSAPITNYALLPGSSAVDSVPASAISLPFGITPSTTDLAGNPRVVDGNGDCQAVQDKGALELQGHGIACPSVPTVAVVPKGLPPIPPAGITGLKISPSAFFAAPSGATISKAGNKAKKTYGATISYSDSQSATTTLVIGTAAVCKKPPKATGKSARCIPIKKTLGTFTHVSKAGGNKLHFSGRIKGEKLAKGSYTLEAIQTTANGRQLIAIGFKIKG